VVFTLQKIVTNDSMSPIAESFESLDFSRMKAIDEHTVEVVFHRPLVMQLMRFADVYIVPMHVYSRGHFRDDYNTTTVGGRPYRLRERMTAAPLGSRYLLCEYSAKLVLRTLYRAAIVSRVRRTTESRPVSRISRSPGCTVQNSSVSRSLRSPPLTTVSFPAAR